MFPFGSAHASYHDLQCDENDIQASLDYYDGECKRIEGSQLTIDQWIAKAWSEYYENVDNAVQPGVQSATWVRVVASDRECPTRPPASR